MTLKHF